MQVGSPVPAVIAPNLQDEIRNHWDVLMKGESVEILLPVLERLETIGFKLAKKEETQADFVSGAYAGLKKEILEARVLHADETPHRMLEGDEKTRWHLWGFSTKETSYFESRDTRSGDVASDLLVHSKCEYLVSDVYSGYAKSVRVINEVRRTDPIQNAAALRGDAGARDFKHRRVLFQKQNCQSDQLFFRQLPGADSLHGACRAAD